MNGWTASENQITPIDVKSFTQDSTKNEENQEKENAIPNAGQTKKFNLQANPPNENLILERHNFFEEILTNKCNKRISVTSFAYCFFGILLSIVSTVLITCWPQHQVLGNHHYWYESLILCITSQASLAAASLVYTCFLIIGVETWNSLITWFVVYAFGVFSMIIASYHLYVSWVFIAGYVWPIPFNGYGVMTSGWWAIIISFWFRCPKAWKSDPKIRKKILLGIVFINMNYAADITYKLLIWAFQLVDVNFQWPLGIAVIVVRELNSRFMSYFGRKINGYRDLFTDTLAKHLAAIRHILFLSVNLGSLTTATTSYLILGSDFATNIFHCFQILWYHNTGNERSEKKKVGAVLNLIVNEGTEFVLPISYAIVVTMAYFGPNAELMGNIKNGLWHYTAIENFDDTIFWIFTLFLFDFVSTLVSFVLLWLFCRINIFKMFLQIQKHVGFVFAIYQAYFISEASLFG